MITTTLNKIKAHDPCTHGWRKLLAYLGKTRPDDEPLPLAVIVESNGLQDALWAVRALPEHDARWRRFAIWCARQVQHLMQDERSVAALDVAERYVNGTATREELKWAVRAADAAYANANANAAAYAAAAAAFAADADAYAACAASQADGPSMQERQRAEFLRIVSGSDE